MASERPRILVIGHTGQTAIELLALLPALGEVVTAGRSTGAHHHIDLANPDNIAACLDAVQPDWVINAAAYNQVDLAEEQVDLAMQINGHAPRQIADWCRLRGATLIHYSTDYVFDGQQSRPYTEEDAVAPLSAYGQSKLAGEQAVLNSGCHGAVLRTSWVYSQHGTNFLTVMHGLLTTREQLSIVNDQFSVPTWAGTLADLTVQILDRASTYLGMQLFHACDSGIASRFQQVVAIRSGLIARGETGLADLTEISSSEFPQPAARPMYSAMSNSKLTEYLGSPITQWDISLSICLQGWNPAPSAES